jgi:hypothetical protein
VSASSESEEMLKVERVAMAEDGIGISEAKRVGARARFCVEKLLRFMGRLRTFIVVWCGGGGRFNSAKVWSGVLGSAISMGAKLRGRVIETWGFLSLPNGARSGELLKLAMVSVPTRSQGGNESLDSKWRGAKSTIGTMSQ